MKRIFGSSTSAQIVNKYRYFVFPLVFFGFISIFTGHTIATKQNNAIFERVPDEQIISPISERNDHKQDIVVQEEKDSTQEVQTELPVGVTENYSANDYAVESDHTSCGYTSKWGNLDILTRESNATNWPSKKMHEAVIFAGMINEVNADNTTFFAVTDYGFSQLTEAQRNYMYESPENMRSVLRWQLVDGCRTLPKQGTQPFTFEGKAGTLKYVNGSPPSVNGKQVVIWDFYTANGVVHYTSGFFSPALKNVL